MAKHDVLKTDPSACSQDGQFQACLQCSCCPVTLERIALHVSTWSSHEGTNHTLISNELNCIIQLLSHGNATTLVHAELVLPDPL
jgi:hypothetical protein